MYKKIIYMTLLLLPAVLMASGGEHEGATKYFSVTGRETDFGPRIFNFLVFAGLIYYLVATPIKDFFVGRSEGIAAQLNEIESKLQEAKDAKKSAEQSVVDSTNKAKEILSDSKKEAKLIAERLEQNAQNDLEILEKQYADKIEHEERRMVKDTINTVLNENITSDDIPLDEDQVVKIIANKVA